METQTQLFTPNIVKFEDEKRTHLPLFMELLKEIINTFMFVIY